MCRLEKAECDITSVERERTKRVVYAVIYGAGELNTLEVLYTECFKVDIYVIM